jgi:predicted metal-dependent hydrolase
MRQAAGQLALGRDADIPTEAETEARADAEDRLDATAGRPADATVDAPGDAGEDGGDDAHEGAGDDADDDARDGTGGGPPAVEVRRSARRRRTVSAYREGGRTVVLIPARMSRAEERRWVAAMLERLDRQDRKRRPGDVELLRRATELSRRHLAGQARPASVRWVGNQGSRWGSCTPVDRTIRLSSRLQGMPAWVIDYVLVHELAHLLVSGHGPEFWAQVARYPRTERARGYLEGVAAASGLRISDDDELAADPG